MLCHPACNEIGPWACNATPAVFAMRERITRECPLADMHALDQLEDRAYALQWATAQYESSVAPPNDFNEIVQEVMDARAVLVSVARGLVACNLLVADEIANFQGGHGYRDAADDILLLVSALRSHFEELEGKMPFTRDQLVRVEQKANRLTALLGIREQIPERAAAAGNIQRRAFRLLEDAYSEVRRVISYVRWHDDDADAIAPPLRSRPIVRKPEEKPANESATTTAPVLAAPADPAKPVDISAAPAPLPPALKRPNPYGTA